MSCLWTHTSMAKFKSQGKNFFGKDVQKLEPSLLMGMDDGAATLERSDISFKQLAYEPAIPPVHVSKRKRHLKPHKTRT